MIMMVIIDNHDDENAGVDEWKHHLTVQSSLQVLPVLSRFIMIRMVTNIMMMTMVTIFPSFASAQQVHNDYDGDTCDATLFPNYEPPNDSQG